MPAGANTEKTPEELQAEARALGTKTNDTATSQIPALTGNEALVESVTKSVNSALSSTLTTALKPVTEKLELTEQTIAKLSSRLDTLEANSSQTRKSVDVEEVTPPGTVQPLTPDPEKVARAARREQREREGILGIG